MQLYVIRHAEAAEPGTAGANRDEDRPLTDSGREQGRVVARALRRAGVRLDHLLTSPLVRARQTAVTVLRQAFAADYVVLGGGNAEQVDPLPEGARRGDNEHAFEGGFRLWETAVDPIDPSPAAHLVWKMV
jgi:broad specificity phosphatase PhoE